MTSFKEPTENVLQKNIDIPVQRTELSTFDDNFSSMKERFLAEMRRVDDEMKKFSSNLSQFYAQTITTGIALSQTDRPLSPAGAAANWECLTSSPLVEGDGDDKKLKLQFDLSQFTCNEVKVKIQDDMLIVSAVHEERSEKSVVYQEYSREFLLPKGIDVAAIVSSLSRDGVLTIQAPLPLLTLTKVKQQESTLTKVKQQESAK